MYSHCVIRLSISCLCFFFFFNDTATTEIYTLSLHDALPICPRPRHGPGRLRAGAADLDAGGAHRGAVHHAAGPGGDAGERGGAAAVRQGGCARDRAISARASEGGIRVRNAECGVRSVSGRSSSPSDLPLRLHIPHSALRTLALALTLATRAEAQVDPSGPWRTLHTAHFRIHFRPAYRDVALLEAREAERSYALLAGELRPPRGVVDLTLGDDVDASNGFTTVFPTSRITIFAAPPVGDHGLLFFDSWLRLVTTHELAHVFHLDRTRGIWSGLQHVFGRAPGLFPNEYQPSWAIEGLATYYESRFTNGGRVRSSFHTQVLAADRAAGASRSPWDAVLFTRWADGLVPYAYGSRFLQSLAGEAGDSVVPRFVEATSGQLIPFRA